MEIPEKSPLRNLMTGDRPLDEAALPLIRREAADVQALARDTVRLTDNGREYRDAIQQARMLPDVRMDRVNQLKQRLAEGTYCVEGKRIAANLMDETVENNAALKHIQRKG